jgi:peptidoglycan/LPS O-acetylase OafA/YrhL
MFFALSGFLVAGSPERSKTLLTFLGLRAIRIYPALGVEVVLSALLIGTAVTTLPLPAISEIRCSGVISET